MLRLLQGMDEIRYSIEEKQHRDGNCGTHRAQSAAYMLCGTAFTPKLRSVSAAYMFENYRKYAIQPTNAAFVKQLGAG